MPMSIMTKEEEALILKLLEDFDFKDLDCGNYEKRFSSLKQQGYWLTEGTTKGVIIPKDKNYVIKIPFFGQNIHKKTGSFFSKFHSNISMTSNYCEAEVIIYNLAIQEGLDFCFAETRYIGTVKGHPIYIQQKALIGVASWDIFCEEVGGEEKAERIYSSISREHSSLEEEDDLSPIWIYDFISTYDSDLFYHLSTFLSNNEVTDLHDENIGYIDGLPVLVDYSSYDG